MPAHFGHAFGTVPVFPLISARTTTAGIARQPAASTTPQLRYEGPKPESQGCGDFSWKVKWILDGATESTNGFIVQKCNQSMIATDCSDEIDDSFKVFWEAWQVKNGKIMAGISDRETLGDEFAWNNTNGSKGTASVSGAAKFIPNYMAPFTWTGRIAGTQPTTDTPPEGWTEAGSKYRYLGSQDYFCCDGKHMEGKLVLEELDL